MAPKLSSGATAKWASTKAAKLSVEPIAASRGDGVATPSHQLHAPDPARLLTPRRSKNGAISAIGGTATTRDAPIGKLPLAPIGGKRQETHVIHTRVLENIASACATLYEKVVRQGDVCDAIHGTQANCHREIRDLRNDMVRFEGQIASIQRQNEHIQRHAQQESSATDSDQEASECLRRVLDTTGSTPAPRPSKRVRRIDPFDVPIPDVPIPDDRCVDM